MEQVSITKDISYIKSSTEPLSAEVGIIESKEYLYLFDVGNNKEVGKYLQMLPKKKKIVLSHFHPDHIGNIGTISFETLYVGANTEKYLQHYIANYVTEKIEEFTELESNVKDKKSRYRIVSEPIVIEDDIKIEIYPIPNSHAKGSLALLVDESYLFLGDALYCKTKDGKCVYNAQLLKEEIELLKKLSAKYIVSSHAIPPVREKSKELAKLEEIYAKRQKDNAYIII